MMAPDTASREVAALSTSQLSPVGRFENVLLATDGSRYSAGAERVALAFCAQAGSHLHILTARAEPGETGWLGPQADSEAERKLEENIERLKAAAEAAGVACTSHIKYGSDPYEVIVQAAEALVVDLVIMGRRGRRGLARIMLGDATAKVIGYAPCAVLVVPEDADMWSSVLIATDGSRYSDMAALTAAEIARIGKIPVTVLSVRVPFHSERRQAEAQPIVDRVVAFMRDMGLSVQGLVEEGVADETIVEIARQRRSGLIVLGNFGRTGFGRVLFGSKDERVINQTDVPVLIARGGG